MFEFQILPGYQETMKTTSAACYLKLYNWLQLLIGTRKRHTLTGLFCTLVLGLVVLNKRLVSISTSPWHADPAAQNVTTDSWRVARSVTRQDVYHKLNLLLSSEHPEPRCSHLFEMGGRCFVCSLDSDGFVNSWGDGQKSVCLDLLKPNCSVLSFGVNNDFSFEEAMEDWGCKVHAFDPTMGLSSFRRSAGINFHDVGIGAKDSQVGGFPVASLGTVVHKTGLRTGIIDYLKLDVESSEWEVLEQQLATAGDLLRVRQLAVEFHLLQWSPILAEGVGIKTGGDLQISRENAARFLAVLVAMQNSGFVLMKGKRSAQCKSYNSGRGCLAYIHETLWLNTRIQKQNPLQLSAKAE